MLTNFIEHSILLEYSRSKWKRNIQINIESSFGRSLNHFTILVSSITKAHVDRNLPLGRILFNGIVWL
jgi:hypothetical protein